MRPDEPKSFDPHEPLDLEDGPRLEQLAERLSATPAEIAEAVEQVGPHPQAVAIFLGEGGAL
jgi:hypothetical protein